MRVRAPLLTIGIRERLSCSLNISCSSPSRASPYTQSAARARTAPSSPARTSSLSSERASSTRSDPSLAHHVSTLDHFECATPTGGRGRCDTRTRASSSGGCSDSGEGSTTSGCGTGSSESGSRSSGGGGCCPCGGNSVSGDDSTNNELRLAREAAQEQAAQWAAAHPHGGARGGNLDRRRRADGTPGENARGDNPDGCGRRWCSLWRRPGRQRSRPLQAARLSFPGSVPWSSWGLGRC
jgi:hypothetical protein